ncbi:MlaA family lipoprotein [Parasphingorhabdus sp. DH2-15]|uniref:MlaA family lipoprotein n=1 Tax=Parasphingorhabdus sp. DH2-15 TaxID=3444112 RepID=UPI003F68536F
MSFAPDIPLLLLSLASSNIDTLPVVDAIDNRAEIVLTDASAQPATAVKTLLQANTALNHDLDYRRITNTRLSFTYGSEDKTTSTAAPGESDAAPLPYDVPLDDENNWLQQRSDASTSQWPAPIIVDIGPNGLRPQGQDGVDQTGTSETLPEPIVVDGIELDTVEQFSLETFEVVEAIDQAVIEPTIDFYRDTIPSPVRQASQNFLRNLGEPVNFLNYLLQLKPGKALETAGRFLINSSLGIGGLIDIAGKPGINLPYRYNGFANTLGYYGVKPGRYLYLPLIGSTTPRDLIGNTIDQLLVPAIYGSPINKPAFAITAGTVSALNQRLDNDAEIDRLREESADLYGDTRDAYLLLRENQIRDLRGLPPLDQIYDAPKSDQNSVKPTNQSASDEKKEEALQPNQ